MYHVPNSHCQMGISIHRLSALGQSSSFCFYSCTQRRRTCNRVYWYPHAANQCGCAKSIMMGGPGVTVKLPVAVDDDNLNAVGGDSGGPYWNSTQAVGVAKGSTSTYKAT